MSQLQLVDVVIVNHNTREYLRDCLKSISQAMFAQVIVVDNASSDGSAEMVKLEFPSIELITNEVNIGYGPAANQAIAVGSAKYILLLNSDVLLDASAAIDLCDYMECHPRVAILGPQLVRRDGITQHTCFPFPNIVEMFFDISNLAYLYGSIPYLKNLYIRTWSQDQSREVPWVLGAAMMMRREAYQQVHGFDESFYMYYEEVDLSFRLGEKAWKTHFTPAVRAIHIGGASTQQRYTEMLVQLYKSLTLFYRRHYSRLELLLLVMLIDVAAFIRYIRDAWLYRTNRDQKFRILLRSRIEAWKQLLSNQWYRASNRNGALRMTGN